ncbi:MAG: aldolase/citrate lyase family protein [Alphaproteobacteria bacterium]|nr:aldolase/citrate lyase family protein [Alphaproteobacteria bacterium]
MAGEDGNPNLLGLKLKEKLAAGDLALCMTVRYSRTVEVVQIAKLSGYDCLYLDLEHSAMSIEACAQISLAASMAGLAALVRVPSHGHHHISRVLDGGAQGVIVPHVDTAEEARQVIEASCYPPLGSRSLAGLGPLAGQSVKPAEAYEIINQNTMRVAMLESPKAIENAEAIAAVDGIDMLLIGTNDLCAEMGIPGQLDHDDVRAAYQAMADACKAHGKAIGIGGIKEGPMLDAIYAMGGRFIMGRVDGVLLGQAAAKEVSDYRRLSN